MRPPMLRIGLPLAIVLALLLGAWFTLSALVSPNAFKPQLASLIHKVSGLEAHFQGDVQLDFFPFGLRFENVDLSMPGGAAGPQGAPLLHISKLQVQAALMPLLDRKIVANAVKVQGLECNVLRNAQGVLNLPEPPVKTITAEKEHVKVVTTQGETLLFSYRISDLAIEDARFLYVDQVMGTSHELSSLTLKAKDITPDDSFPVLFSCLVKTQKPDIEGNIHMQGLVTADPLRRLIAIREYSLQAEIQGNALPHNALSLSLAGAAALDGTAKTLTLQDLLLRCGAKASSANADSSLALSCPQALMDMNNGILDITPLSIAGPKFKGKLKLHGESMTTSPQLQGELDIPACSPRSIFEALGIEPPRVPDQQALQLMELQTEFQVNDALLLITSASLTLDEATLQCVARLQPDAEKAWVECTCDDLDLDRYLPLKQSPHEERPEKAKNEAKDATPAVIPEQLLKLDLDAKLRVRNLHAAGLAVPALDTHVQLRKGRLDGSYSLTSFYKGSAKGALSADLNVTDAPPATLTCDAKNIRLQPLLRDLSGKERLSGTASLRTSLDSRGLDLNQLRRNLHGTISLRADNGAVLGFSLTPSALKTGGKLANAGGSIAYQNAQAKGTIDKGVVHLQSISARFDPNSLRGAGTLSLVNETMHLDLTADFLGLAGIPMTVKGPWSAPQFTVAPVNLVQEGAKALGNVLESPEKAGKALGDFIKGFAQ